MGGGVWSVGQGEVVGGKGVWPRPRPRAWHQQWRCGTGGGGLCQRVWKEGRGGWVGGGRGGEVVMSVQQGEVVGALEVWPRSRPRV